MTVRNGLFGGMGGGVAAVSGISRAISLLAAMCMAVPISIAFAPALVILQAINGWRGYMGLGRR